MNASDNTSDPRHELHDRLTDQALHEALGGKRPPDLTARIVSVAMHVPLTVWHRPRLALAASLLLVVGSMVGGFYAYRTTQVADEQEAQATNNLKQLAMGSHGFHDANQSLPSSKLASERDKAYTIHKPVYEDEVQELGPAGGLPGYATDGKTRAPLPGTVREPFENSVEALAATDSSESLPSRRDVNDRKESLMKSAGGSLPRAVPALGGRGDKSEKGRNPSKPNGQQPGRDAESEEVAFQAKNLPSHPTAEAARAGGKPSDESRQDQLTRSEQRLSSLELRLTPRIIVQEEEEQLLDIAVSDRGRGPGEAGDRYSRIVENPFLAVKDNPLSTFSIDVDTASYTKARRYIEQNHTLPPPDAVRIEEFVNYFSYDYAPPADGKPFSAAIEVAACPWRPDHRLVRVGLKGREIARENRPTSNLVFLLDVSGSMQPEDKLPRVRRAMRMLVDQLGENDRVAITVYAGASGLVLTSTPGANKETIVAALDSLHAGGSTNGASGIELAYQTATANFIKGGTNRVILCTDGDFNVGTASTAELERLIEAKARTGVFLTVLGFGMGNHNDDMLEKLADKGNGNYGYIDSEEEARKMLVEELGATLVTIAKDVKLQVEFNPAAVAAYRLVGYENRMLRAEDFNDDKKDAGEIGAGHTVTALYEIIPAAGQQPAPEVRPVEPLRYQKPQELTEAAAAGELLSLKIRYKDPDADKSHEPLVFPVQDEGKAFGQASADFKFAAAVSSYAMLLRGSEFRGQTSLDAVLEIAQEGLGPDKHGYRAAFLNLVRQTKLLVGEAKPE